MHWLHSAFTEAEVAGGFKWSIMRLEELFYLAGFSIADNQIFIYDLAYCVVLGIDLDTSLCPTKWHIYKNAKENHFTFSTIKAEHMRKMCDYIFDFSSDFGFAMFMASEV